jgi:hypothetical protein
MYDLRQNYVAEAFITNHAKSKPDYFNFVVLDDDRFLLFFVIFVILANFLNSMEKSF